MIVKNNGSASSTLHSNTQTLSAQYQKHINSNQHPISNQFSHNIQGSAIEDLHPNLNQNMKEYGNQAAQNYQMLNNSNSSQNTGGNASAATLLLSNILNNINEKDTSSQSFLQTYNSINMLKQDVQGSSNALYQFLKNKHLSKEIQKRTGQLDQPNLSKNGSRAYIDVNEIKKDEIVSKYDSKMFSKSGGSQKKSGFKNYDTTSSQSRGSSNENTPNKFRTSYHSSLKKVKSQSQFNKTSVNAKDHNSRSTSQTHQLMGHHTSSSPMQHITNDSTQKMSALMEQSMTQSNNNFSTSSKLHSKSVTKGKQQSGVNNNALTQNWMNSFLEQYDVKNQMIQKQQHSLSQQQNRPTTSYNTYQKFLNNSQAANISTASKGPQKPNSMSLNKSVCNPPTTQQQTKHTYGKSTQIQQRRSSGSTSNNAYMTNFGSQTSQNLNKSYQQNTQKTGTASQYHSSSQQQNMQIHHSNSTHTTLTGKTIKKSPSFLANTQGQQPQSVTNGSGPNMLKVPSQNQFINIGLASQTIGLNSTSSQSKQSQGQIQGCSSTKTYSLFQPQSQQAHYPAQSSKYSSINYHKANNRRKDSMTNFSTQSGLNKSLSNASNNPSINVKSNAGGAKKHQTKNSDSLKHNQSMVIGASNTQALLGSRLINGGDACFQFDEILKNIDRQAETQANNPVKKFNLSSEENSPIRSKDKQPIVVDNQSSNRLESLLQIFQSKYSKEDREKMVNDVFNDIISSQKCTQDSQSLQIIKEFFQREQSTSKQRGQDILKAKDLAEQEKHKRIEAETKMQLMLEELKKAKTTIQKQDQMLNQLKTDFAKVKQTQLDQEMMKMKQIYSQSEIIPSNQNTHFNSSINGSLGKVTQQNISNVSNTKKEPIPRLSQPIPTNKPAQNIHHHIKTKSAAAIIPKLDLSKLKRDVDILESHIDQNVDDTDGQSQSDSNEDEHVVYTEDLDPDEDDVKVEDYNADYSDKKPLFSKESEHKSHFKEIDLINRKSGQKSSFMMMSDINFQESLLDEQLPLEHIENIPSKKPLVPLLDFSKLKGVAVPQAQQQAQKQLQGKQFKQQQQNQNLVQNKPIQKQPQQQPASKPSFKLNFDALKKQQPLEIQGFQDEFMSKLDEYSQSWRDAAIKEQRH